MKVIFMAGLTFFAAPVLAAPVLNAPDDVMAIKALEQQNGEQLKAADFARTFAPDAILVDYMVGGVYQGRPAIRKRAAARLAPLKSLTANLREQHVLTDGKFACDMLTADFQFVTQTGSSGAISLRLMDALKKAHGQWQVVQEQIAMPSDPRTGMAVSKDLQVRGDIIWPSSMTIDDAIPLETAKTEVLEWINVSMRVVGIDAVLPYYGPGSEEVVMYAPTAPGNLRGKAEMHDYYAPSMNSFESLVIKTPVLKVDTDGALGAVLGIQNITLHLRTGKTQPMYWRQSDCVARVNGKWYGLEDLASFPVDLKTGKSAAKWDSFPVDLASGTSSKLP